jgi:acyl-CoA thioesterase
VHEFDRDTELRPIAEGRWRVTVSSGWNIGTIPNGGFLLALLLSAAGRELPHPDPLTATAHYLGRVVPDEPAELTVDVLRAGRTLSTASISLHQMGRERIRALATHGDLEAAQGPTLIVGAPPPIPDPDECVSREDGNFEVMELQHRLDSRLAPSTAGGVLGRPTGSPEIGGWVRFADGRMPDLRSLALFADAFPPTVFNLGRHGWIPTIELTVHFRAKPSAGWLRAWFRSRFLVESHVEEDGEIWDSDGKLVALSRQLARVL